MKKRKKENVKNPGPWRRDLHGELRCQVCGKVHDYNAPIRKRLMYPEKYCQGHGEVEA